MSTKEHYFDFDLNGILSCIYLCFALFNYLRSQLLEKLINTGKNQKNILKITKILQILEFFGP